MNSWIIQITNSVGRNPEYWNGTTWCTNRNYAKVYKTWLGGQRCIDRMEKERPGAYIYAAVIGK